MPASIPPEASVTTMVASARMQVIGIPGRYPRAGRVMPSRSD